MNKQHTFHLANHWLLAGVLLFVSLLPQCLWAQTNVLRQGKLPNGLTYYIYNDGSIPGEAQYYLYQNVGAVLEENNETGLAHFLEHLAFNTTDHFSEGVMSFLRQNNLHDFEAYTGLDETKYAVHNVPTNDAKLNEKMLLVLKDWCHGIKILPKDVEKERGIVLEEWRHRAGLQRRLTDSIANVVYNHSRYATRNVIGSEARIKAFTAKELRAFYDKWYRPNLQFVAIIGDVNLDETEKQVKRIFGSLPSKVASISSTDPRAIENNSNPLFYSFVDKENKEASLGVYQRKEMKGNMPEEDRLRFFLFTQMFNKLAPRRFAMIKNADKEAFIAAEVSLSALVRNQYQVAWDVVPYNNKAQEALQQIMNVRGALRDKGFGKSEFEAEKSAMYKGMKDVLEAKGLGTPDNIMNLFKQNFLYNTPIIDFRAQIQRNIESLVELEVEDINAWMRHLLNNDNLSFITYSKKANELSLTENNFVEALKTSNGQKAELFSDTQNITQLIDFPLTSSKIVSEKQLKELNAKEWKLSNGARVLYKYLPEAKGRVFFAASSEGGRSVVAPQHFANYTAMRGLLMQSGVYKYSRNDLAAWLQHKDFDLSLALEDYSNGIGGNTSAAQLDDFLAYVHLILTKHNFSKSVFDKYIQRSKYLYNNKSTAGMEAIQDSIQMLLFPPSAANPVQNEAFFDQMQWSELPATFDKNFGNAALFTYCLVGDVPESTAKELVLKYIGSLKGDASVQKPKVQSLDFASDAKEIKHTFVTDLDGDMAEIEVSYLNNVKLTDKEQAALEVMRSILENRYFEELREKEHLTYTVGVKASYTSQPTPTENISIHLSTSRPEVDKVLAKMYSILNDIKQQRFSMDEFKAALVPLAVDEESEGDPQSALNPSLWLGLLNVYAETGEQLTPQESNAVEPVFNKLTPQDIAAVATKVFDNAKHREIVVKAIDPEKKQWEK